MDACGVSSSSSSSSSSFICEKYDVFLSFRGEDTRNNFTSHLYAALKNKQIKTYIDEESLEKGDDITLLLPEAIQKSEISIVIFSANYASSTWCLRELVQILECRRQNKQRVIPIFYGIDPSHIRKQQGSYEKAFLEHEVRFKDSMGMVKKWRVALTESADLSGWDSKVTRPDTKLVDEVVKDVLKKLRSTVSSSVDALKGLVGMEKRLQQVELLLSMGSPNTRIIGLWGMGGIGKTTLANVVYGQIFSHFESCRFLKNVREESGKVHRGLEKLRKKLFKKLLREENIDLETPSSFEVIKTRLKRTRVLIVLDDVSNSKQIEHLIGDGDLFASGSRILLTTRDQKVLRKIKGDDTIETYGYEVDQLDYDQALELFNLTAFNKGKHPTSAYTELSRQVVDYARGNPLAIKVLGSELCSLRETNKEKWEMTLRRFKKSPPVDIHEVLRISYDGLEKDEKNVFLDIACFFNGERRDFVENILNGHDVFVSAVIDVLIDKCLVTIDRVGNVIQMHDLLQEMGQEMVCKESENHGERSRLWIAEDIFYVLQNNEGTKKIEGIFLDMADIDEELHLKPEVFQKMSKLRFLAIYNTIILDDCYHVMRNKVHLPQDLHFLPHTLRLLHWQGYPSKCLPFHFSPRNLVEINLSFNQLEIFSNEVQNFESLKRVDLRRSLHLTEFPDFSHAPKLENINLECSTNLLQVSLDSLQNLDKLIHLNLSHCYKLQIYPLIITKSLTILDLSSTAIQYLPSSIGSLNNLSKLSLNGCTRLAKLPSSANKLDSLKYLNLEGCSTLKKFPKLPWNIEVLNISGTAIREVASSSIKHRRRLKTIFMSECKSLESLPTSIFKLRSLAYLYLNGCLKLKNLPEILERNESLKGLFLRRTGFRQLPSSVGHLVGVTVLCMNECENLESIPSSISDMVSLENLHLSKCPKLEYFPEILKPMENLRGLHLEGSGIRFLPSSVGHLIGVTALHMGMCENLESVPSSICNMVSLKYLRLSTCRRLKYFPEISKPMKHFRTLHLEGTRIRLLPLSIDFLCCHLQYLYLMDSTITEIPASIKSFSMLKGLHINNCKNLRSLPNLPLSLRVLDASGCESLEVVVSNLNTRLTQEFWDHYHTTKVIAKRSVFIDCLKLDKKVQHNIIIDFHLGVLLMARRFAPPERQFSFNPKIAVCFPGKKIPKRFEYQSEGPFIDIKLPPQWHNSNFLGFMLCAVGDSYSDAEKSELKCEIKLKNNLVEYRKFTWGFNGSNVQMTSKSPTVYMWFQYQDYRECFDAEEASFHFLFKESKYNCIMSSKCEVKKCGIAMVYRTDLEDFGINLINTESSSHVTIDYSEDENPCLIM